MRPFRALSRQSHVYLVVSASFALAALQNVTVDDAVLTGAVVPQYLPSSSAWNIGNNCTGCFVKPNPSLAYNGTWHDTTYSPSNSYTQAIEFTFTGTALYIFFIIANTVPYATTFTDVGFVLDQLPVSTYIHTPSTSTDYQYNVAVYANDSLALGEHNMMIQPVNSGNDVLILFDYLIYTTGTDTSSSASTTPTSSPSVTSITTVVSPSPTSSGTGTSPGPNTGAIVGGTVGGVAALVLATASFLCYRKYKRRDEGPPSVREGAVVEPFVSFHEVPSTSLVGTTTSTYPVGLSAAESTSRSKMGVSSVTPQSSIPPASTAASSSAASSGNNAALLEQVELLRGEVAHLRNLQDSNRSITELQSEAPPEYSS